jgi:hypothetical protein
MINPEKHKIDSQVIAASYKLSNKPIEVIVPNNAVPLDFTITNDFEIVLSYLYKQNLIIIPKTIKVLIVQDKEEFFTEGYYYVNTISYLWSGRPDRWHCFVSQNFMLGELENENPE